MPLPVTTPEAINFVSREMFAQLHSGKFVQDVLGRLQRENAHVADFIIKMVVNRPPAEHLPVTQLSSIAWRVMEKQHQMDTDGHGKLCSVTKATREKIMHDIIEMGGSSTEYRHNHWLRLANRDAALFGMVENASLMMHSHEIREHALNTFLIMYRLLESQQEADEMLAES